MTKAKTPPILFANELPLLFGLKIPIEATRANIMQTRQVEIFS